MRVSARRLLGKRAFCRRDEPAPHLSNTHLGGSRQDVIGADLTGGVWALLDDGEVEASRFKQLFDADAVYL